MASATPPPASPEDDGVLAAHLAYLGGLVDRGIILVNGPFRQIDDPRLRGMSLYTVDPDEARGLANDDPAVKHGWFQIVLDEWMFPAIARTLGDRTDVEVDVPEVSH